MRYISRSMIAFAVEVVRMYIPTEAFFFACKRAVNGNLWSVFSYCPTIFKPFIINMEKLTLRRRVRFFFEWLAGYTVYYLYFGGALAGYVVIARGGSRRYGFSSASDILAGPVFIDEAFRGRGLSTLLLREALKLWLGNFENAYAYIEKTNAPSLAAFRSVGFAPVHEAAVSPVLRRVSVCDGGSHFLMKLGESVSWTK